jgi:chemotaxis protein MotC
VPDAKSTAPIAGAPAAVETDLQAVEGAMAEKPAVDAPASPSPAPLPIKSSTAAMAVPAPASNAVVAPDPADAAIADARRKLESIDQILGASPK